MDKMHVHICFPFLSSVECPFSDKAQLLPRPYSHLHLQLEKRAAPVKSSSSTTAQAHLGEEPDCLGKA